MERPGSPERLCRVLVAPPGWKRSPDCLSLRTMGTRPKRGPDWLRSDRTENVAAVIMVTFFTAVLVWVLVDATPRPCTTRGPGRRCLRRWPPTSWSASGWPPLLPRWRTRWMRDLRSRARGQHWGVPGMFLRFGLMFVVGGAPAFAEAYACEQGDGIVVTTSWTHTSPEGVKSGVVHLRRRDLRHRRQRLVLARPPGRSRAAADGREPVLHADLPSALGRIIEGLRERGVVRRRRHDRDRRGRRAGRRARAGVRPRAAQAAAPFR